MRFTKKTITDLARMCSLVYDDKEIIDKKYSTGRPYNKNQTEIAFNMCKGLPNFISSENDCQVFYVYYDDVLLVCFRGTESKSDVLTDLNCLKETFKLDHLPEESYPEVHQGFKNQFDSVKSKIDDICCAATNIVFCGHSLGGALATLASLYYAYKNLNANVSCVTFGSPRVGDYDFVRLFDHKIKMSLRYVNDNDPVPCLPTSWRYKHVKGLRWLNQDIIQKEIKVWRFYRFLKNTFLNTFGYGYNALDDHSCSNYITDLECIDQSCECEKDDLFKCQIIEI